MKRLLLPLLAALALPTAVNAFPFGRDLEIKNTIGVFLIWLYSAYIFINKWQKVKKGGNVKRRNALLGKVENVSAIIELVDSWSKLEGYNTLLLYG